MDNEEQCARFIFSAKDIKIPHVDDTMKKDLRDLIHEKHELVTIFEFDVGQYNGKLEEAILDALMKGIRLLLR